VLRHVSVDSDKYSKGASYIAEKSSPAYEGLDTLHNLQHKRYQGGARINRGKTL